MLLTLGSRRPIALRLIGLESGNAAIVSLLLSGEGCDLLILVRHALFELLGEHLKLCGEGLEADQYVVHITQPDNYSWLFLVGHGWFGLLPSADGGAVTFDRSEMGFGDESVATGAEP